MDQLIPLIITLPLIAFWAWMFHDMVGNYRLVGNERYMWLIGFIFLSLLVAGYYYFTEYKENR